MLITSGSLRGKNWFMFSLRIKRKGSLQRMHGKGFGLSRIVYTTSH